LRFSDIEFPVSCGFPISFTDSQHIKESQLDRIDDDSSLFAQFAYRRSLPGFVLVDEPTGQGQLTLVRRDRPPHHQHAVIHGQQQHRNRQRIDIADCVTTGAGPRPGLIDGLGGTAIRTI